MYVSAGTLTETLRLFGENWEQGCFSQDTCSICLNRSIFWEGDPRAFIKSQRSVNKKLRITDEIQDKKATNRISLNTDTEGEERETLKKRTGVEG